MPGFRLAILASGANEGVVGLQSILGSILDEQE